MGTLEIMGKRKRKGQRKSNRKFNNENTIKNEKE